jgi:uncharacterized membrane protein YbhN (UPF0104 family)
MAIKILLSIALLLFITNKFDVSGVIQLLKNVNFNFLYIAILVFVFQIIIASIRWKIILNNFNFELTYMQVLRYLWIGLFFNQALPSSIGGDALRGYYLRRNGGSIRDSTIGVLLDRVFGMVGLVIMVILVTPLLINKLDNLTAQWGGALILALTLGIIIVVFVLDLLPFKLANWRLVHGLYALSSSARKMLFSNNPGIILVTLSITIHLFSILAVIILSESLLLEIEWLGIFIIIPLVILFMLIPISIAGWGVREGVMIVGLGYLGVQPEQALTLSILYGLLMLIISLPGGVIWLFSNHPPSKES